MNFPRLTGNIAKWLVSLGVLLLTFTVYQLWGTGIQHSLAQNALEGDFEELIEDSGLYGLDGGSGGGLNNADQNDGLDGSLNDGSNSGSGETDGGVQTISNIAQRGEFSEGSEFMLAESVVEALPQVYRDSGDAIAKIRIQKIGLNEVIVEGTEVQDLKKGPGHYATTPLPGQPGNASIAGHRTTYGAPFANIHKLEKGDEIVVTTIQGTFSYRVIDIGSADKPYAIVSPGQSEELDYKDGNHLTLTSCHPRYSAAERIIVRAELEGSPAVPLPRPEQISEASAGQTFSSTTAPSISTASFGTGLNGDRSVMPSLILWVFAILGILAAVYFWGRNWHKWKAYSISALPLLLSIFTLFYYVDSVLPSY